jgi:hypothetical protein
MFLMIDISEATPQATPIPTPATRRINSRCDIKVTKAPPKEASIPVRPLSKGLKVWLSGIIDCYSKT